MSDKAIIGGYIDRTHLSRAVRANREMTEIGLLLVDRCPPRMLPLMGRLGLVLATQRDALAEMERIRRETK